MAKLIKTKIEVEGRVEEEYALVDETHTTPWDVEEELRVVGKPVPRVDGVPRVTGAAQYTTDVHRPGMLYAKFLRSPHPHARIVNVNAEEAEKIPGVWAIFTHENTPPIEFGRARPLLGETVRFVGDEVAAVVAESEVVARAALKRIRVEYEPLPFVLDPEEAAKPDAPLVHEYGNLLHGKPDEYARGDVERGLSEAHVVVQGAFSTPTQLHNSLETHASVAEWDGHDLIIWDSTQNLHGVRDRVAELLGLDRNRVQVRGEYVGGGFGSKNNAGKHTVMAALIARRTGRPVRFVLDRHEENIAAGNRSATRQHLTIGAKKDGTLTAIQLTCYCALGAFAGWGGSIGGPVHELYACPNVLTRQFNVFTNTGPFSAFRAPGYVEGTFPLEVMMDELAEQLGIDPLELRIKNYASVGPLSGLPYSSNGLLDAYQEGARAIDWSRRSVPPETRGSWSVGLGMASQIWGGAGGPPSYALVKVNSDASATIITGTLDIGTGTKTVLCQIAAEELGLPIDKFQIEIGDTERGLYSTPSWGSMTLASMGPAVREAAADAKRQVVQLAAQYLRKRYKSLRLEEGFIRGPKVNQRLGEILEELGDIMIIGRGSRGPNPGDYAIRTFGAQFAQVAVDVETGEIRVEKIVAAHDSGRIINPLTTSSQIEGGVIQGMGYALTEERVLDPESGVVLNANLEEYLVPTIRDAPAIEVHMIDRADNLINNIGAKGVGEPPIIPTAAAIANAVYHATGIHFHDIPLTRERVLDAMDLSRNHAV
jgi:xanthine dehydrogenase YagR molybdenum-binding subunit